jgi:hypothetical protein
MHALGVNAFDPLAATTQYLHMIDPVREAREGFEQIC